MGTKCKFTMGQKIDLSKNVKLIWGQKCQINMGKCHFNLGYSISISQMFK